MDHWVLLLFLVLIFIQCLINTCVPGEIEEIVAKAGDEVLLSCPVNTPGIREISN